MRKMSLLLRTTLHMILYSASTWRHCRHSRDISVRRAWCDVNPIPSVQQRKGVLCVDVELQLVNIASGRCVCLLVRSPFVYVRLVNLGNSENSTTRAEWKYVGWPREQTHEHGAVGELRREPHPGELTC